MLALPKAELALCCQFSEDEEAGRRGQTLPAVVNDRAEAAPAPVTTPAPPVTTPTPVAVTTPSPTSSTSASPEQRSGLAAGDGRQQEESASADSQSHDER